MVFVKNKERTSLRARMRAASPSIANANAEPDAEDIEITPRMIEAGITAMPLLKRNERPASKGRVPMGRTRS
jgi:hypothetical protein